MNVQYYENVVYRDRTIAVDDDDDDIKYSNNDEYNGILRK